MKVKKNNIGSWVILMIVVSLMSLSFKPVKQFYYKIKVYHYSTAEQQKALNEYLKNAYLPALHRNGVKQVGVFNTLQNDSVNKAFYVLLPFEEWSNIQKIEEKLQSDTKYQEDAAPYLNSSHNKPPYTRIETMLLQAFSDMPAPAVPVMSTPKGKRIYELRSYESATEKYHVNKVAMFNKGNEIGIFKRLGFNAVFYGSVLEGNRMPNLVYMVTFDDMQEREKHWNTFIADAEWKAVSVKPEYENNVSRMVWVFLQATDYSDF